MNFDRTDLGKINKYLFYQDPVVWVEGPDDIPFYEHGLITDSCVFIPAGGKNECIKLASAIKKYGLPYIVVLDGHYEILRRKRTGHRWIVILGRHSIENYLFEKDLAQHVCYDYICLKIGNTLGKSAELDELSKGVGDDFDRLLSYIESQLSNLVVLDVANCMKKTGCDVLPDKIDPLCQSGNNMIFLEGQIAEYCNKAKNKVSQQDIDDAESLISDFCKYKRFIDIVPGHLVYGILRRFIKNTIKRNTGKSISIDDEGMMLLLTAKAWLVVKNRDHESLKRRLRKALTEVRKVRQSQ